MQRVLFYVKILGVITFCVARCELMLKPLNYAMLSDKEAVVLQCYSTLGYPLTWLIKKPGLSSTYEIFNGYNLVDDVHNVSSYCKVDNGTPGKYELNVKATREAAQQYICVEPGSWHKASAEVTIIESRPECNVTSYNESIVFTCHVRFRGNWSPVMEWQNGSNGEVISESVYNISIPNKSLTSHLIVHTNQSHNSKMYYTCTTKFRIQEKPSETTADNIPSYSYKWTSPEYIAVDKPEGRVAKHAVIATCIIVSTVVVLLVSALSLHRANKRRIKQLKCQKDSQNQKETETFTNNIAA